MSVQRLLSLLWFLSVDIIVGGRRIRLIDLSKRNSGLKWEKHIQQCTPKIECDFQQKGSNLDEASYKHLSEFDVVFGLQDVIERNLDIWSYKRHLEANDKKGQKLLIHQESDPFIKTASCAARNTLDSLWPPEEWQDYVSTMSSDPRSTIYVPKLQMYLRSQEYVQPYSKEELARQQKSGPVLQKFGPKKYSTTKDGGNHGVTNLSILPNFVDLANSPTYETIIENQEKKGKRRGPDMRGPVALTNPEIIDLHGQTLFDRGLVDMSKTWKSDSSKPDFYYTTGTVQGRHLEDESILEAMLSGGVPIVSNSIPREDLELKIPSSSFIHVEDFETSHQLVDHVEYLMKNNTAYSEYHKWRKVYDLGTTPSVVESMTGLVESASSPASNAAALFCALCLAAGGVDLWREVFQSGSKGLPNVSEFYTNKEDMECTIALYEEREQRSLQTGWDDIVDAGCVKLWNEENDTKSIQSRTIRSRRRPFELLSDFSEARSGLDEVLMKTRLELLDPRNPELIWEKIDTFNSHYLPKVITSPNLSILKSGFGLPTYKEKIEQQKLKLPETCVNRWERHQHANQIVSDLVDPERNTVDLNVGRKDWQNFFILPKEDLDAHPDTGDRWLKSLLRKASEDGQTNYLMMKHGSIIRSNIADDECRDLDIVYAHYRRDWIGWRECEVRLDSVVSDGTDGGADGILESENELDDDHESHADVSKRSDSGVSIADTSESDASFDYTSDHYIKKKLAMYDMSAEMLDDSSQNSLNNDRKNNRIYGLTERQVRLWVRALTE